ncbi:hypothetical protein ACVK1X_001510 [Pseudomonas sp. PvR086]|jgi:hypothetical protein
MAPSQQPRPSAESFQSLTTDLSTGLSTSAHTGFAHNKKVDKAGLRLAKNT